jgi:hypothetical protein
MTSSRKTQRRRGRSTGGNDSPAEFLKLLLLVKQHTSKEDGRLTFFFVCFLLRSIDH